MGLLVAAPAIIALSFAFTDLDPNWLVARGHGLHHTPRRSLHCDVSPTDAKAKGRILYVMLLMEIQIFWYNCMATRKCITTFRRIAVLHLQVKQSNLPKTKVLRSFGRTEVRCQLLYSNPGMFSGRHKANRKLENSFITTSCEPAKQVRFLVYLMFCVCSQFLLPPKEDVDSYVYCCFTSYCFFCNFFLRTSYTRLSHIFYNFIYDIYFTFWGATCVTYVVLFVPCVLFLMTRYTMVS